MSERTRISISPLRVITRSYLHTRVSHYHPARSLFCIRTNPHPPTYPPPTHPHTHTHTHARTHTRTRTRTPQNQPRARRPDVSRRRTKAGKIQISNRGVIVTCATRLLPTVCSEKKKTDIIKKRKRCVRKTGEKPRPRIIESRLSAGLSRDRECFEINFKSENIISVSS